jgi:YVTN family beta-propeller protein
VLDFRILGPFEVTEDGEPLPLGSPRQRALLLVLLLHRGEPVSTDRLIDELWGEQPPPTATKIVHGYVSHLRKVLGDGALVTRGGGYLLVAAAEQVDAERFTAMVGEGREAMSAGDAAGARELLAASLSLWRGDALADFSYEPFAEGEIARLEEARLAAREDRIEADLSLSRHRDLVSELESMCRRHPTRERLLGSLMVALYRSGRQADALEVYRRGRAALSDDLGIEPGVELRALQQRILTQDPGLDLPASEPQVPRRPSVSPPEAVDRRGGWSRFLVPAAATLLLAAAIAAAMVELTGARAPTTIRAGANAIAGIDVRTNRVAVTTGVGVGPGTIASSHGSLWIANVDDRTISRLNRTTLQPQATIHLGEAPTGITATGSGVWVATFNPTTDYDTIDEVDPHFNQIAHHVRVANTVVASGAAIAPHGRNVWVAPYAGDLIRLDSAGRKIAHVDPNSQVTSVAVGAGATWVTDNEAGEVIRIDPTGLTTPIRVGNNPSGIAVGGGYVWVADTGDDQVVKIDPNGQAVLSRIPVGDAPLGVAYGAGSVWVANSGAGTVSRIDPRTDRATPISVGGSPQSIVVAGRRAWVTIDAPVFGGGTGPNTLREVANNDISGTLDPAIADDPLSWQLLYATCARLLNYPDRSGAAASTLIPEVARSLPVVTDSGRTYTFTIRRGFRFAPPSDAPVTAAVFKHTIERTLAPAMHSPERNLMEDIVGAKAYMAGKAKQISGVVGRGNKLIIRLTAPAPDLSSRLAEPFYCAVPSDTPIDPAGENLIPSAGPYTVVSYTPGQGAVLKRNPNYHGNRPHHFARIDVAMNVPTARGVAEVETGAADYDFDGAADATQAAILARRFGAGSTAAKRGHQQYFVNSLPELDYFALNTQRGPFRSQRLRQAVNYAIDRRALARLGDALAAIPEATLSHVLPPGIPGYREIGPYPSRPDLAKARALASGFARTRIVLDTCDYAPCGAQAQIIKTDLAAIGLNVIVRTFSISAMYSQYLLPHAGFDMGYVLWDADYPDPDDFLNMLIESGSITPALNDPSVAGELAAAKRLTGASRVRTYARLDRQITSTAAPFVVFGDQSDYSLFSSRIGCQVFSPYYGMDLAALCLRGTASPPRSG